MKGNATIALIAAFIVSFFAIGLPYWQIPYSQASLPSSLYRVGLVVVFMAAVVCRYFETIRFRSPLFIVGAAVPSAILVRVEYETGIDPTSHNLWPFEIVIAALVGFSVSLAGSLVGGFLMPLIRNEGKSGGRKRGEI